MKNLLIPLCIFYIFILCTTTTTNLSAKDIVVVGSSTVYPFITINSEIFGYKHLDMTPPVVESNGTSAGFKFFCENNSINSPSIATASRKITSSEIQMCQINDINPIELKFGYDAIVLITPQNFHFNISLTELYLATAKYVPDINGNPILNPYHYWNEINKQLPKLPIRFLGPSSAHGTRDAFIENSITPVCKNLINQHKLIIDNNQNVKALCTTTRNDDSWIVASDDENLVIKKVSNSSSNIGIIGYNYYYQTSMPTNVLSIDNVNPEMKNFINHTYPLMRELYLYVKPYHLMAMTNMQLFLKEVFSQDSLGPKGYLKQKGFISIENKYYQQINKQIDDIAHLQSQPVTN